ncbi:hypothetical protein B0H10DRAFT_2050867 [Mycena sp. CBHHK59/15]|nr:hypothetical protein B0H10DRAFT_2050867 [Mycena sp. CBHHK59/15]
MPVTNLHDAQSIPVNSWPLLYTCDMADGFRHISQLQSQDLKTEAAYCCVFARPWKSSTYSENFRTWQGASEELKAAFISKGRTSGGEWKVFRAKCRRPA